MVWLVGLYHIVHIVCTYYQGCSHTDSPFPYKPKVWLQLIQTMSSSRSLSVSHFRVTGMYRSVVSLLHCIGRYIVLLCDICWRPLWFYVALPSVFMQLFCDCLQYTAARYCKISHDRSRIKPNFYLLFSLQISTHRLGTHKHLTARFFLHDEETWIGEYFPRRSRVKYGQSTSIWV